MDKDYDVVVVGAGPAGSAAALYAQRAGLSVLLLDKRCFPRDKICGDAIARKSLGYMRDLGLSERLEAAPHQKIGNVLIGAPGGDLVEGRPQRGRGGGGGQSVHDVVAPGHTHADRDPLLGCDKRELSAGQALGGSPLCLACRQRSRCTRAWTPPRGGR